MMAQFIITFVALPFAGDAELSQCSVAALGARPGMVGERCSAGFQPAGTCPLAGGRYIGGPFLRQGKLRPSLQ